MKRTAREWKKTKSDVREIRRCEEREDNAGHGKERGEETGTPKRGVA